MHHSRAPADPSPKSCPKGTSSFLIENLLRSTRTGERRGASVEAVEADTEAETARVSVEAGGRGGTSRGEEGAPDSPGVPRRIYRAGLSTGSDSPQPTGDANSPTSTGSSRGDGDREQSRSRDEEDVHGRGGGASPASDQDKDEAICHMDGCDENDEEDDDDGGDDEDDNANAKAAGRKKKTRTVFSRAQVFRLEATFDVRRYLSGSERGALAAALQLSETQVKIWFQNRRNKWKRQLAADMEAMPSYSTQRMVRVVPILYQHDHSAVTVPQMMAAAPSSPSWVGYSDSFHLPLTYRLGQPLALVTSQMTGRV